MFFMNEFFPNKVKRGFYKNTFLNAFFPEKNIAYLTESPIFLGEKMCLVKEDLGKYYKAKLDYFTYKDQPWLLESIFLRKKPSNIFL